MIRFAFAFAALLVCAPALAASGLSGCDAFLEKVRNEASDLGVEFTHALVVSRARSDTGMFDITTKSETDGVLTCRGDSLMRFEAHVSEPASSRAAAAFERLSSAAVRAATSRRECCRVRGGCAAAARGARRRCRRRLRKRRCEAGVPWLRAGHRRERQWLAPPAQAR